MADEIVVSGIGDLITAAVMRAEYDMLLADRADFFGHPCVAAGYAGSAKGSNVVKVGQVGLMGYDLLAAGTPATALSNTALTDASDSITVAWYGKSYEMTDLAQAVSGLDPVLFARDAAITVSQTLVDLLAGLAAGYSQGVGATGVDMTVANFADAITALEIGKAGGPYLAVLHPRQWGDLRNDSLSLGGAVQHRFDSQAIIGAGGQYKGTLFGVDVFVTSHVDTANSAADRAGMMVAPGAFYWADAEFPANGDPNIVSMGRAALERVRTGKAGLTAYVTHAFLGVAEGQDLAGVKIVTDA